MSEPPAPSAPAGGRGGRRRAARTQLVALTTRPAAIGVRRAVRHHQDRHGGELAAAITLQAVLALVPLAVLGLAAVRAVLGDLPVELSPRIADDETPVRTAKTLLDAFLPGLSETLLPVITSARPASGLAAVLAAGAGVLLGLSWVRTVRRAVRVMLDQPAGPANVVVEKLQDLRTLLAVVAGVAGVALLAVLGRAAIRLVLEGSSAEVALQAGTQLLGTLATIVVAATLLSATSLPGGLSRRGLWAGVLGTTAGVEVAKLAFLAYASLTASRNGSLYGAFALLAGLLIWLSLVSRILVAGAAGAAVLSAAPSPEGSEADVAQEPPSQAGESSAAARAPTASEPPTSSAASPEHRDVASQRVRGEVP